MATTVDWPTKVISVPRADMLLTQTVPTEIRELNLDLFRLDLKALEASDAGMPWVDTHRHNPPVTVGGVTLARVVEIINGYTVTFEDGQYAVNLVGANSNVADVTNVNQVSVRSANSAGLTYSKEIQDQSFPDGRVFIDSIDGVAGTQYPLGTLEGVDNYADARMIVDDRGMVPRYILRGDADVTGKNISRSDWLGTAATHDTLTLGGANTTEMVAQDLKMTGMANGTISARNSILANVSNFDGFLIGGAIGGTLTLAAGEAHIVDVHAAASGENFVTIDYDGQAAAGFFPGLEGSFLFTNHSHASALTHMAMKAGHITLDASCTDGVIVLQGNSGLTDNSGPNCLVITKDLLQPEHVDETWSAMEMNPDEPVRETVGQRTVGAKVINIVENAPDDITATRVP